MPQPMQAPKDRLSKLRDIIRAQQGMRKGNYAGPRRMDGDSAPSGTQLPLGSKGVAPFKQEDAPMLRMKPEDIKLDLMPKPVFSPGVAYDEFIKKPLPDSVMKPTGRRMDEPLEAMPAEKPKAGEPITEAVKNAFAKDLEATNKKRKIGAAMDNLGRGMTSNVAIWNRRGGQLISTPVGGSNTFEKAADIDKENVLEQEKIKRDQLSDEDRAFIEKSLMPEGAKLPADMTYSQL